MKLSANAENILLIIMCYNKVLVSSSKKRLHALKFWAGHTFSEINVSPKFQNMIFKTTKIYITRENLFFSVREKDRKENYEESRMVDLST